MQRPHADGQLYDVKIADFGLSKAKPTGKLELGQHPYSLVADVVYKDLWKR